MPSYQLPDGSIPVLLSSDSADLLKKEAVALLAYVEDHADVTPDEIASMLFRTRVARRHRALAMVTDRAGLLRALRAVADGAEHPAVVATTAAAGARRVGYVFPGQGSQRAGMGRLFYDTSPAFRAEIDACDAAFHEVYGTSPRSYILDADASGDNDIRIVQPALFMQMVGLAAMWRAAGVAPAAVIGHSQGEIAAAYVSGAMTMKDAIRVVSTRARVVHEVAPRNCTMAVVAIDRDECEAMIARHSGWAELSVINSPHILCVSGERTALLEMIDKLTEEGKFAREIRVEYPAHTSVVSRFQDQFRGVITGQLDNGAFLEPSIPCIGATLGGAIFPDLPIDEYWFWNLRNAVRFDFAIASAVEEKIDLYVEIAENPTLMLAIQENLSVSAPGQPMRVVGTSRRSATDLREFTRNLGTIAVNDTSYSWDALRVDTAGPVPLPLRDFPNVQMQTMKLWAKYIPTVAAAVEVPDEAYPQRVVENWVRLDRRSLTPPRTIQFVDHTGECADLATALIDAADGHGATAALYDPDRADTRDFDTVVILLPSLPDLDAASAVAQFAEFFGLRRWWPPLEDEVRDIWLVTVGGEVVTPEDGAANLFHGAVTAGYRSIATEHPAVTFRHLDLARDLARPAKAASIVAALHTAGESDLALRGGKVYAKRLVLDQSAAIAKPQDLSNVVIIGGTGKLGLEFAEHYARLGADRVTLLSRSGESAALAPRLESLRALGKTEIVVSACDVSDESAVLQQATEFEDSPASLVLHAAVNYVDSPFEDVTPEAVEEASRSKVLGVGNVLRAFPLTPACKVVMCSSVAATLGGRGQLLYAVTNRMLDVMAQQLREQGVDCVSVQWGLWSVQGPLDDAGVAKVEGAGVIPMNPGDAIAVGLADPRDGIVISADWAEVASILSVFGYGPMLSPLVPEDVVAPAEPEPVAALVAEAPAPTGTLAERILHELNLVMGVDDADAIDGSVPLVALGLDSLQALDFRKRVKAQLNRDLPVAAILGGASLDEVVALMSNEGSVHV
ncbi:nocobactin polyketide synthase NbtC [Antrihabitans sp. YC2-6]|uniref:nocobactin polyketide synthase NbtC n=1 Tax=Antrihabitans sp. YC2-6 TaxID=2799498 RepID=UPI0018F3C32B|nr:nocobactin polyketide synthase NbtC [Antrihabitans sp. YC2-6]MBJ8346389.1 nocobactin polyketide synthase NbtC [Antrihabitans sp. YC2-6]